MALDARHRTSIYQKLVPILGDDDCNALMTEFPSIEADELVTKQFLRAEMAELRSELRGEMAALRSELQGNMAELRVAMAELQATLTRRLGVAIAGSTAVLASIGVLA